MLALRIVYSASATAGSSNVMTFSPSIATSSEDAPSLTSPIQSAMLSRRGAPDGITTLCDNVAVSWSEMPPAPPNQTQNAPVLGPAEPPPSPQATSQNGVPNVSETPFQNGFVYGWPPLTSLISKPGSSSNCNGWHAARSATLRLALASLSVSPTFVCSAPAMIVFA